MFRFAALVLLIAVLAGCGGESQPSVDETPAPPALTGARERAPAPTASGALTQIADSRAARTRLAYANLARLDEVGPVIGRRALLTDLLGRGGARVASGTAPTAIRVADRSVLRGPEYTAVRPQTSAITPAAPSAVQSCLGDTVAQTIVGPHVMGRDAAIGVGLRTGADAPAGVKLAICWAPYYRRDIHAAQQRIERGLLPLLADRDGDAVVGEIEIGEREILSAVLPAEALPKATLRGLLRGRPALTAIARGR